jgi:hypothetical protein
VQFIIQKYNLILIYSYNIKTLFFSAKCVKNGHRPPEKPLILIQVKQIHETFLSLHMSVHLHTYVCMYATCSKSH